MRGKSWVLCDASSRFAASVLWMMYTVSQKVYQRYLQFRIAIFNYSASRILMHQLKQQQCMVILFTVLFKAFVFKAINTACAMACGFTTIGGSSNFRLKIELWQWVKCGGYSTLLQMCTLFEWVTVEWMIQWLTLKYNTIFNTLKLNYSMNQLSSYSGVTTVYNWNILFITVFILVLFIYY